MVSVELLNYDLMTATNKGNTIKKHAIKKLVNEVKTEMFKRELNGASPELIEYIAIKLVRLDEDEIEKCRLIENEERYKELKDEIFYLKKYFPDEIDDEEKIKELIHQLAAKLKMPIVRSNQEHLKKYIKGTFEYKMNLGRAYDILEEIIKENENK